MIGAGGGTDMIKKKTVKELLAESLEELLKSKPFEKITVNEIAENCGVGRRTFYYNFKDKYDIAAWLYLRQLNSFLDTREEACLADFIKHSTEVVSKDLWLIAAINKYKGQNNIRESLVIPMTELYCRVIEKYHGCEVSEDLRKDIAFFVGGQITYVSRIIDSPKVPTAEEAAEFFIRCAPESIKKFL